MALDYGKCAREIFSHLGGRENLVSGALCATRLRLVTVDNSRIDMKALGDVFVPILPAIVASGLMMGLVEALGHAIPSFAGSDWYGFLDLVSATAFAYLPVLIAVWLMCQIEKRLHKVVPEAIDLFVTPLVSVLATVFLTFTIIGPIFSAAETYILNFAQWLITVGYGVGSLIIGAIYPLTVVCGMTGGAVGAMFGSFMGIGANAYGVTGIPGFLIVDSAKILPYAILLVISGGIAFALTWFVWKEDAPETKKEETPAAPAVPALTCAPGTVYAPVAGTVIPPPRRSPTRPLPPATRTWWCCW